MCLNWHDGPSIFTNASTYDFLDCYFMNFLDRILGVGIQRGKQFGRPHDLEIFY